MKLLLSLIGIGTAIAPVLTAAPIFDGKTLAGWTGDTDGYRVENGVLIGKPKGRHIYTEKEYSDFRFTFDFKLSKGANSGIGIRTPLKGDPAFEGIEIQVLDDAAEKWANLHDWQYHGSIYGIQAAERGHLNPLGEWNHQEITVVGDQITVVLNGHTINDLNIAGAKPIDGKAHPGLHKKKGHIGLLGHGDPVEFRNLDLEDLSQKPLFDGKTLDGWKSKNRDQHWSVKNGEIHFDGKGQNLITEQDFADFELQLEYKITPGGDSGVYLRGTPQVQIWDPEDTKSHPAGSDKGSGALWNNKHSTNRPLVKADKPSGEWNHMKIQMKGSNVTVHLNGTLVTDNVPLEAYPKKDQPLPATGPIELQAHGSPLFFRNLQIREYPSVDAKPVATE